jgi:predicted acyltransferase
MAFLWALTAALAVGVWAIFMFITQPEMADQSERIAVLECKLDATMCEDSP